MHNGGHEYNDEVGMMKNNLQTLMRACKGMYKLMQEDENMPEWVQEKVAHSKAMMVTVWDYMLSQHAEGEIYFNESNQKKANVQINEQKLNELEKALNRAMKNQNR